MKLKYYLRGLGIGIVVTALLMGFATRGNQEMSDEEIKARAAELGMVEQLTLADIKDNTEQSETVDVTGKPTQAPLVTIVPTAVPETISTEVPENTAEPDAQTTETPVVTAVPELTAEPDGIPEVSKTDPEATASPEDREGNTDAESPAEGDEQPLPPEAEVSGDVVLITIYEGNNSVNVSRVLEEAGLIESATAFDRYLRNNGYSKIINTGRYRIALGTSEEQIAHIITNTD